MENQGNFKLTIFPAVEAGHSSISFLYNTAEEMVASKDTSANLLIYIQDTVKVMGDYSNVFYMEVNVDGEWEEYEEDF